MKLFGIKLIRNRFTQQKETGKCETVIKRQKQWHFFCVDSIVEYYCADILWPIKSLGNRKEKPRKTKQKWNCSQSARSGGEARNASESIDYVFLFVVSVLFVPLMPLLLLLSLSSLSPTSSSTVNDWKRLNGLQWWDQMANIRHFTRNRT